MQRFTILLFLVVAVRWIPGSCQNNALVFQSDFGVKDGAVAAMKGVAYSVSRELRIFDITHEIPVYNIWEAAYRLHQTVPYWPANTVFVSIVDPGVGSARRSVVLKTKSGHYVVTPDNGTLSLVAESLGVDQVREIDEVQHRLKNSEQSYTFYGRDVYAYTGAKLAAGLITFEQVGPLIKGDIVRLNYQKVIYDKSEIRGNIPVLDIQFGNVWTNIDQQTFQKLQIETGDAVQVTIYHDNKEVYKGTIPLVKTFADVDKGKEMCYLNSLLNFSLGINNGSFSDRYSIKSGPDWVIVLRKG